MPTHNVVRASQLAISISIVATAAFLLHYRTRSHSNFTNEPLISCITGTAAFIYALWAILNHRRQPDNHRWIYLHGLGCLVVCGLLIAGSTLVFIYTNQGTLCERFQDSKYSTLVGSANNGAGDGYWNESIERRGNNLIGNMIAKRDLPEYKDGEKYPPGALCENSYEDMDKACGVMGVIAALLWLFDFCLILGFCDSSSPHRNTRRRRRGQVQPDDIEEYYPAGEILDRTSRRPGQGNNNIPQDECHDNFHRPKREVHWLKQRTNDDPKQHVQGPIPYSMQQEYFGGVVSAGAPATSRRPPFTLNHNSSDIGHHHETRPTTANIQPLSPPPLPRTKWEQPPDSPTQTVPQHQGAAVSEVRSADALAIPPVLVTGPVTPPFMTLSQAQEPSTPESERRFSSSKATSPRSPGPACYAFDSSQRGYFPSYVNMAARIEQRQQLKQSQGETCTVSGSEASGSPAPRVLSPLTTSVPAGKNGSQRDFYDRGRKT